MDVRAVFFDFGGTLAEPPEIFRSPWRVWKEVGERHGLGRSDDDYRGAVEAVAREEMPRIYGYVGRTPEFWRGFDAAVLDRLGVNEGRAEVADQVESIFHDLSLVRPYPEAVPVLAELRSRGYRLGVISNHNDQLLELLRSLSLDRFFTAVTYSQEAGAEKPARAIFDRALTRLGCAPGEAVHVGDSLGADIEGARSAGIFPVWVNRDDPAAAAPGVTTVHSLAGLLTILP